MVLLETGFKKLQEFFSKYCKLQPFCETYAIYCTSNGVFAYSHASKYTGTSFVDFTTIDMCDSHSIQQHKVFKDIANFGLVLAKI